MKKQKLEYAELHSLQSALAQLQRLLEGFHSGALVIARGDRKLLLSPAAAVEFALHAEQAGAGREKVKLSLEWQRHYLSSQGELGASAQAPRAVDALDEPGEFEAREIEPGAHDDGDDGDDEAVTLRQIPRAGAAVSSVEAFFPAAPLEPSSEPAASR